MFLLQRENERPSWGICSHPALRGPIRDPKESKASTHRGRKDRKPQRRVGGALPPASWSGLVSGGVEAQLKCKVLSAGLGRLPDLRPRPPCSVLVQGFLHQGRLRESLLRGPPAPHSQTQPPVLSINLCWLNSGEMGAPRGLCRSGHAPSSTCLPGKR